MEPTLYTIKKPEYAYISWHWEDGKWFEHNGYSEPEFVHEVPEHEVPVIVRQKLEEDQMDEWDRLTRMGEDDEIIDMFPDGECDPAGGHGLHSHE